MTKYIITLLVLIVAGGAFLYSTQTVQAPTTPDMQENPFGEGGNPVGTLENGSTDGTDSPVMTGTDKGSGTMTGTPSGSTVGSNTGDTGSTPGVVSRAELAKHNTQADCWISYKGTVYDITNWLPRHPGSADAIAPFCGTAEEFAAAFNGQHGTSKDKRLEREGVKEGALGN